MTHSYHLFGSDGLYVVYEPTTMRFFRVDETAFEIARAGKLQIPPPPPAPAPIPAQQEEEKPVLERFVFIVTTKCNLRCRYCYAGGGNYGMPFVNMSREVARQAITWMFKHFSHVQNIQFFGGEPSLNYKLIGYICDEIENHIARNGNGQTQRPQFGLITNGTYLPPAFEELIERYRIHVTYSIDGPAEAHNIHRVYVNGRGSFSQIEQNFQRLKAKGITSLGVEMTLTPQALENGYSVWDLVCFSARQLGILEPHIVPVGLEPDHPLNWDEASAQAVIASYREAAARSLESLLDGAYRGFSFLGAVLRSLILRRPRPFVCPAGVGTLAVDPWGDIYPCFMFTGQADWRLGNVMFTNGEEKLKSTLNRFLFYNHKTSRSTCEHCWARYLCTGCLGNVQTTSGNLSGTWALMCEILKGVAEETMLFLARIQGDPETWKRFVNQYKRFRLNTFSHSEC